MNKQLGINIFKSYSHFWPLVAGNYLFQWIVIAEMTMLLSKSIDVCVAEPSWVKQIFREVLKLLELSKKTYLLFII